MQEREFFREDEFPETAQLNGSFGPQFQEQMKQFDQVFTPEKRRELQKQFDQLGQAFKVHPFTMPEVKIDPSQMEELQKQMENFGSNFSIERFRIDPKEMEELNRQMQEWRKSLPQMPCLPDQFIRYEGENQELSRPA